MSRGYWLAAIAVGLILFAGLGQAQEEANDEQGQATQQEQPTQTLPIPLPVDIVEDQADAEARERREAEAHQNQIDDLIAQQGMNDSTRAINNATQEMRDYAYVQTWLVGVGTILLFATLFFTWQANRAAQDAVSVTREIGEAQTRAYVQLDDITPSAIASGGYRLHINFINTGQTPAMKCKFAVSAGPYENDNVTEFPIVMDGTHAPTIAAGRSTRDVSIVISGDLAENAADKDSAGILVWGVVEYDDVFVGTKRRRTEFCLIVGNIHIDSAGRMQCGIGTYDRHNGADGDCMFPPTT